MKKITSKIANEDYSKFKGSDQVYLTPFFGIKLSEGVHSLVKDTDCLLLIETISAFSTHFPGINQAWTFERRKGSNFKLTATDFDYNPLTDAMLDDVTEKGAESDFPYDKVTLWVIDGYILFPSEY